MRWLRFIAFPIQPHSRRGQVQDRMLTQLCDGIDRVEDLDWSKADRLIRSELTPLESAFVTGMHFQTGEAFASGNGCTRSAGAFSRSISFPENKRAETTVSISAGIRSGLQPKTRLAFIEQELHDLGGARCRGTFPRDESLDALSPSADEQTAALVGAEPIEVVVMNSLTVNLHLMMASFYRPPRSGTRFWSSAARFLPINMR